MRSVLTIMLVLSLGCGAQVEEGINNLEGCKLLASAMVDRCGDSVEFLNCDRLPGCPNGSVEKQHVEECAEAIRSAASCEAAKQTVCSINKVDCDETTEEDLFNPAIGFTTACGQLITDLAEICPNAQNIDCAKLLPCQENGAFAQADITNAIGQAKAQSSCEEAKSAFSAVTIRSKFCFDTE
jgi:hypothetical protein